MSIRIAQHEFVDTHKCPHRTIPTESLGEPTGLV